MTTLKSLGVKHTTSEIYKVYCLLPYKSPLLKGVKSWYPYKHYSTIQGAKSAIKKYKEKHNDGVFKIVWAPYPFASDEECFTLYDEDFIGGEK